MLSLCITTLSSLLNDYLKLIFKLDENIVNLRPLSEASKTQPTNKIHLFLVNIERETAGGLKFSQQAVSNTYHRKGTPIFQLNLYLVLASVFSEKQYEESLQFLSGVLSFLQNNNLFSLTQEDILFTVEPVNLSFQELSNLWSICGGIYYPSVVCKIRTLNIDATEIKRIERTVQSLDS